MLLCCDSFDYYTTLDNKYDLRGGAESIQSSVFRNGIQALRLNASAGAYVQKFISNTATIVVGAAWFGSITGGTSSQIFSLIDNNTTVQTDLRVDAAGALFFTRNGTQLGSKTSPITMQVWHYVEMK